MGLQDTWQTTCEYTLFLLVGFVVLFQDFWGVLMQRKLFRTADPVRSSMHLVAASHAAVAWSCVLMSPRVE